MPFKRQGESDAFSELRSLGNGYGIDSSPGVGWDDSRN